MTGHIDTHFHFFPKAYLDAIGMDRLASVMPNQKAPSWTPEGAIAMMDGIGTQEGILSIPSGPPGPEAPKLLRDCNDTAAGVRSKYPGRFGHFAGLPLPDIDASLWEIDYALDTLNADGFLLVTNYDGKYLGDPIFAPVMEELNRRKTIVFVHPTKTPYDLAGLPPQSVLEFPFDTTRTAASLIMSGAIARWPSIRFILSHAGGTLPFMAQRLAGSIGMTPEIAERVGDVNAAIRSFWYDTALSVSKPALAALMAVADPTRILFGTDYPTVPQPVIEQSVKGLKEMPLPEDLRAAIFRGNAASLLRRLA